MKIKRGVKILIIVIFLFIFISIAVFMSLPEILKSLLIAHVSFNKDYKIEIGQISGDFYSHILIDHLVISNKNTDETVISFKNLKLEYEIFHLIYKEARISKLTADFLFLNLYKVRSDRFNLEDIFRSGDSRLPSTTKKKKKDGWKINVREIELKNSGFVFDDNTTRLQITNIKFSGNLRNTFSASDTFRINISNYCSNLDLTSPGLDLSDILAEELKGHVIVSPQSVIWNISNCKTKTGEFLSSGQVLLEDRKFSIQVDVGKISLEEIDDVFIHDGNRNISGDVYGRLKIFGSKNEVKIEGDVESREIYAYGQVLKNINSGILIEQNKLILEVSQAEWNDARVQGSFRLFFDEGSFVIKGTGENLDPVLVFPDLGISSGDLIFSSGFILEFQPQKTGSEKILGSFWDITGRAFGYPVRQSSFSFVKDGDDLHFRDIKLSGGYYLLSGFGSVILGEIPQINFEINTGNIQLENFISGLSGNAEFYGRVFGTTNNFSGDLHAKSGKVSAFNFIFSEISLDTAFTLKDKFPDTLSLIGKMNLRSLTLPVPELSSPSEITVSYKLDYGKLSFEQAAGKFYGGGFNVFGSIDSLFSASPVGSLNVIFDNIEFSPDLNGGFPAVKLKVSGNGIVKGWIDSYDISINSVIHDIYLDNYTLDPLIANININPEFIDAGFNNDSGTIKLTSRFYYLTPDIPFSLNASVSKIKTDMLLSFTKNPFVKDLSGNFRADITAGGSFVRPDFHANFSTNIYNTVQKVELGILTGVVGYNNSSLNLSEIKLQHELYSIYFNGSIPVVFSITPAQFNIIKTAQLNGVTQLKGVSLETIDYLIKYLPFLQGKVEDFDFLKRIEGQINGNLMLSGFPDYPEVTGELTLIDGRIKSEVLSQQTEKFFAIKYKKAITTLSFDITDLNGKIIISPSGLSRNLINIPSITGKFRGKNNEGNFRLSGLISLDNFKVDDYELRFFQSSGIIPIILPDTDVSFENIDVVLKKTSSASKPSISGFIKISEAKTSYDFIRIQDIFSIIYSIGTDLLDVIIRKEDAPETYEDMLSFNVKNDVDVNLRIQVKDNVKFTGTQQNFFINAKEVSIIGSLNAFTILGEVDIQGGKIYKWGHVFNMTKGGIKFDLEDKFDPELDLQLQTRIQEYLIQIKITGRKSQPQIELSSIPDLDRSQIFSLLFIHQMPEFLDNGQKFESEFIRELLMEQFITEGFDYVTSRLSPTLNRFFDVKRLKIEAGEESDQAKELYRATLGKYITPRMYLSYSSYVNRNPRDPSIALNIHVNSFILFKSEINLNQHPERNTGDSIGIEVQRTVDFNKYLFKMFKLELKSLEE